MQLSVSEAQKKSVRKYQGKNNKRFGIIMKKSEGEMLEKYLKNNNYSVNGFIIKAIKEKIERDTGKKFNEFLNGSQDKTDNNFSDGSQVNQPKCDSEENR